MNELAIKLFGLVLLASVLVFGGCRWQHALDEGRVQAAERKADELRHSLRDSAGALSAAAASFRSISSQTAADAEHAAFVQAEAKEQAKAAHAEALAFQARRLELERQAAADRKACPAGGRPICGSPLR